MTASIDTGEYSSFFESFEFEKQQLEYIDMPFSGYVRAKKSNERFAFYCETIIVGLLWHWMLVPASGSLVPVDALRTITPSQCPRWLSIVEDKRTDPGCYLVT